MSDTGVAPASSTPGRRGATVLSRVGRGSERPWDPTNRLGLLLLCLVLVVGLSVSYDNFFTVSNAFTILLNITAIGIAAFGSGLLVISGNVDLSIGGQYALVSVVTATVVRDTQNIVAGIVTALALGALLGFVNGRLVRALKINPLIVTLAMALVLRGLAYLVTDARSVFGFPEYFAVIGRATLGPVPVPVVVGTVVFVVGGYLLLHTVVGLHVYAVGGNPVSTELAGVRTDRLVTSLFMVNGSLVGLVALMTTSRLGSAQPSVGLGFELDVLTAVILGGVAFAGGAGHPLGILIGVITIGVLDAGIIFAGVPDFWQDIVSGSVLLLALGSDQVAAKRRERGRTATTEPDGPASVPDAALAPAPERVRHGPPVATGPPVISCVGLAKSYGSVAAVRGVTFDVRAGEILCLVGDNGAGKSSVIKMMSGATQPDSGTVQLDGEPVRLADPGVARGLGIQTAYQDLALCPNLGAAHNLVLGAEPVKLRLGPLSIRDDPRGRALAASRLGELGIVLDDDQRPVRLLSGGQRQSVAIARIAEDDVRVVILDEPTAALGVKQTRGVLDLVRVLRDRGAAVVLISHDIETVFELADRIVVLRLGRVVHAGPKEELDRLDLVRLMTGLLDSSATVAERDPDLDPTT